MSVTSLALRYWIDSGMIIEGHHHDIGGFAYKIIIARSLYARRDRRLTT